MLKGRDLSGPWGSIASQYSAEEAIPFFTCSFLYLHTCPHTLLRRIQILESHSTPNQKLGIGPILDFHKPSKKFLCILKCEDITSNFFLSLLSSFLPLFG